MVTLERLHRDPAAETLSPAGLDDRPISLEANRRKHEQRLSGPVGEAHPVHPHIDGGLERRLQPFRHRNAGAALEWLRTETPLDLDRAWGVNQPRVKLCLRSHTLAMDTRRRTPDGVPEQEGTHGKSQEDRAAPHTVEANGARWTDRDRGAACPLCFARETRWDYGRSITIHATGTLFATALLR